MIIQLNTHFLNVTRKNIFQIAWSELTGNGIIIFSDIIGDKSILFCHILITETHFQKKRYKYTNLQTNKCYSNNDNTGGAVKQLPRCDIFEVQITAKGFLFGKALQSIYKSAFLWSLAHFEIICLENYPLQFHQAQQTAPSRVWLIIRATSLFDRYIHFWQHLHCS